MQIVGFEPIAGEPTFHLQGEMFAKGQAQLNV